MNATFGDDSEVDSVASTVGTTVVAAGDAVRRPEVAEMGVLGI